MYRSPLRYPRVDRASVALPVVPAGGMTGLRGLFDLVIRGVLARKRQTREKVLMRRTRATPAPPATAPPEIHKPDERWRQELTRQQYDVLRRGHTEPAFTGRYLYAKDDGSYCCAGCGNEL